MESLDLATRVDLVRCYYQSGSSSIAALRMHRNEHKLSAHVCHESTVGRLIKRFEATGAVVDLPREGRPSVSHDAIDKVEQATSSMQKSHPLGTSSVRKLAAAVHMPKSTVHKILRDDLQWNPYRLHLVHELKEIDFGRRKTFAAWFLDRLSHDSSFLHHCLWTDEAHFTLDGSVFTRNCVIWSPTNPHAIVTHSLHPQRITVWCGFTSNFILPPYFFDSCTINQHSYLRVLNESVIPELHNRRCMRRITFQQDGAPPHIATAVKELLAKTFGNRIISRHFENEWPPRSPDIAPPDYWLWGSLKAKVYASTPKSLPELKSAIQREVATITSAELKRAVENLIPRLHALLNEDGGHFEHYFSHTDK